VQSLNVATARLAQNIGIDQVVAAARDLGIDAPLRATPSLALGSSEVTLLDLTGAYASVLAGRRVEPWGIAEIQQPGRPTLAGTRPWHPASAGITPYQQQQLMELLVRTVREGTGRNAALSGFSAGKTGTAEDYRDAWFIGFNEHLVVGVWVGNDDNAPMRKVTGGDLPASIWKDFMTAAMKLPEFHGPDSADEEPYASTIEDLREWAPAEALISGGFGRSEGSRALSATCDYEACSSVYRSFRSSDCSHKAYSGQRRLCLIGRDDETFDEDFEEELLSEGDGDVAEEFEEEVEMSGWGRSCNYEACSRSYLSFRASDCSYKAYSGERRLCRK
jgi:membrane peptidoglycan carboxypeptidase